MLYATKEQALLEPQKDGSLPSKVYVCDYDGRETLYSPDSYALAMYVPKGMENRPVFRTITEA